jgi:anti-sigma factor RsiW
MTQLSDEFLLAYLDGQLERGQSGEVSQLTKENAEISRRVARLKRTQAQLIESFGAFAREEIALPRGVLQPDDSEGRQAPKGNASPHAAARAPAQKEPDAVRKMLFVIAVFAGGLLGGYGATVVTAQRASPPPPKSADRMPAATIPVSSWTGDIARFHSFFPQETLIAHPDAISNPELIRFQLSKITAKALAPPDFTRQGYTLYRGQTFNYRQDRMMQLTYSSKTDASRIDASKTEPPLTLYALPASELPDSPIAMQALGSNKAASWVTDRVRFLLTGEKNEEDLKVLAAMAQAQMPRKP